MNNTSVFALICSAMMLSTPAIAESNYDMGGMVRVNYSYVDYDEASKDKYGDMKFEVAAFSFNGEMDDFGVSMEYRLRADFDAIKHGYAYYTPNDDTMIRAGVTKVPFGNIGFISNSFWLSLQYYVGFEDDYDTGFSVQFDGENSRTDVAFFKGAENSASMTNRFAADLYTGTVNGTEYTAEESNQINLRQSFFVDTFGIKSTIGASVEYGQMYDNATGNNDNRYAYAVHYDGTLNGWNVQAQYLKYEFDTAPEQNAVALSVVGAAYEVASEASSITANVSKTAELSWGTFKFYNDFNVLMPEHDDFDDSYQNVTGMSVANGPLLAWFDFIVGKNMLWSSRSNHVGLQDEFGDWDKKININLGYYF
ncbi:hypothetical protein EKG39_11885 [Shewanella atlantica]|uniref:Porin n=2 Tax=Shewanella atlantica TaxID=271099 RepID=A0A3S0LCM2_9GAMM|nr:hypothetical protein EKG39_11885 [Shewanella atlantica]